MPASSRCCVPSTGSSASSSISKHVAWQAACSVKSANAWQHILLPSVSPTYPSTSLSAGTQPGPGITALEGTLHGEPPLALRRGIFTGIPARRIHIPRSINTDIYFTVLTALVVIFIEKLSTIRCARMRDNFGTALQTYRGCVESAFRR